MTVSVKSHMIIKTENIRSEANKFYKAAIRSFFGEYKFAKKNCHPYEISSVV